MSFAGALRISGKLQPKMVAQIRLSTDIPF